MAHYPLSGLGRDATARADVAARFVPPGKEQYLYLAARLAVVRRGEGLRGEAPRVRTPADASSLIHRVMPTLATDPQEQAFVAALDVKRAAVAVALVYRGTLNSVKSEPSNFLRVALLTPSVSFIVFHVHPSGNPTPSAADVTGTQQMIRAGLYVGLQCLDHVVLTPDVKRFHSIRESHPQLWE
jgi:DNA repair protein RadC